MNYETERFITTQSEAVEIGAVRKKIVKNDKQSKIRCFICNQQGHVVAKCRYNSFTKSSTHNGYKQIRSIDTERDEKQNPGETGAEDNTNKFIFNYGVYESTKGRTTVR